MGGVSPAVSGEESGGVLRVEGDGGFVSHRREWWFRRIDAMTTEKCSNLDCRGGYRKSTGKEAGR
jgi:hypothetical protein